MSQPPAMPKGRAGCRRRRAPPAAVATAGWDLVHAAERRRELEQVIAEASPESVDAALFEHAVATPEVRAWLPAGVRPSAAVEVEVEKLP